jgi:hypothetical protein
MKKIISKMIIGLLITGSFYSCYYDKADYLYNHGAGGCDTVSTVLYSLNVRPVLEQQCYSCHSSSSPSGGIAMGTYNADKAIAANGKLYGSVNHASGYSPMPQGQAKMEPCTIGIIKKWIDAGSPNN